MEGAWRVFEGSLWVPSVDIQGSFWFKLPLRFAGKRHRERMHPHLPAGICTAVDPEYTVGGRGAKSFLKGQGSHAPEPTFALNTRGAPNGNPMRTQQEHPKQIQGTPGIGHAHFVRHGGRYWARTFRRTRRPALGTQIPSGMALISGVSSLNVGNQPLFIRVFD